MIYLVAIHPFCKYYFIFKNICWLFLVLPIIAQTKVIPDPGGNDLRSIRSSGNPSPSMATTSEHCTSPEVLVNGAPSPEILEKVNGNRTANGFNYVEEIQFVGIIGKSDKKRICRITCIKGVWVGPSCSIHSENGPFESTVIKECSLRNQNFRLQVTHNHSHLPSDSAKMFPDESIIKIRCKEAGAYKLIGHTQLQCKQGAWDYPLPKCESTTIQTNFSLESPPAILHTVLSGSMEIGEEGTLIVTPGSTIHLDCVWARSNGEPEWSWSMASRQYPVGWNPSEDFRTWRYRVSIRDASHRDSGDFRCITPQGKENSMSILVEDESKHRHRRPHRKRIHYV